MKGETASSKEESSVGSIKTMRSQLEARIESQHNTHLDLLSSLRNIVPDIVSSLDLSLNLISNFNNRNFNPTPPLPEIPKLPPKPINPTAHNHNNAKTDNADNLQRSPETGDEKLGGEFDIDESGSPLAVVRAMVAVYLLQRVPFKPIDSYMLLTDVNVTPSEKRALRELGGESGEILAVETALRSVAEDNGGVELEELSIGGKSRVMVLSIDRIRLLKELPESVQQNQEFITNGNNNSTVNQNQIQTQDPSQGDLYGIQRPEMWGPHMAGMASIYGGGGMMGPRGRGVMGMQRGGRQQKPRTEEDDWNDIQEMLSKKTYKESQRSKTGEELLDLIQRPTAKETAVAAKVFAI